MVAEVSEDLLALTLSLLTSGNEITGEDMGLFDALRSAFGSSCDQLIKYQAGVFKFKGIGADVPPVNVSFGGLQTGVVKLEHATEIARNLDLYQFLMCKLSRESNKISVALLEQIIRARAVALVVLTSFSNTLAAFKADPGGESANLSRAVKHMQNVMKKIEKEILGPENVRIEKITDFKLQEKITPGKLAYPRGPHQRAEGDS